MKWEKEFLRLAGFLLLCRYQVIHGRKCTEVRGHVKAETPRLFMEISYLGMQDSALEMDLLLKEVRRDTNHLVQRQATGRLKQLH